jgi:hypothetical protein
MEVFDPGSTRVLENSRVETLQDSSFEVSVPKATIKEADEELFSVL